MPTYTYRDKRNGDILDCSMSISEMEKFEEENPNYERVYVPVGIVDPVGIGVTRPPSDFSKYVLGKVKAANPHTQIGKRRWAVDKEI